MADHYTIIKFMTRVPRLQDANLMKIRIPDDGEISRWKSNFIYMSLVVSCLVESGSEAAWTGVIANFLFLQIA